VENLSMAYHGRLFLSCLATIAGCSCLGIAQERSQAPAEPERFPHAVVAADHPAASNAGLEMLRQGGNVVDAAVATAFALSVVRPESCGIGGGGFMLIWDATQRQAVALDYRERAPSRATRDMFTSSTASGGREAAETAPSEKGGLAIAVPGDVAGLCHALEHHGTLDRPAVLAPAIRLAREGVPPDSQMHSSQRAAVAAFAQHPEYRDNYPALFEKYLNAGKLWQEGDRFHSPLADVLELIAEHGPDAFYRGPVADAIVAEVQHRGGIMTLDDLAEMRPTVREPLRGRFDDYAVITMPPPSSGGVALLETLNILAAYEAVHPDSRLERLGHNTAAYVHLVTEALKHAFADRAEFLGDPDFADVPVARLISPEYAASLVQRIDPHRTKPRDAYGRSVPPRDAGTSHFCVIDAHGNAVACTETINTSFGSFVVEPRYGIVLNNEMDDFTAVPGKPNAFGLIQSEANAVGPRKKPLSSMTPTIFVRDGKAVLSAGAAGGPRIISGTLQVLLNMSRFDMPPQEAVAAPRFHHQWLPDELLVERSLADAIKDELTERGHDVRPFGGIATTQAVRRSPAGVSGGSDPRRGGRPAGY
jgi:gamma-glutamyltranspeptidase/glutathione hydrolase